MKSIFNADKSERQAEARAQAEAQEKARPVDPGSADGHSPGSPNRPYSLPSISLGSTLFRFDAPPQNGGYLYSVHLFCNPRPFGKRVFMAQKVKIILVDDLDGGSADETVRFGLDGVSYEIDLSSGNAANSAQRWSVLFPTRGRLPAAALRGRGYRPAAIRICTDPPVGAGQRLRGKQPWPYPGRNSGSLPEGEFLELQPLTL